MKPTIIIAYCPKCGWLLRAAYMAQELLTTFQDDLHGILLHPSQQPGTYTITINGDLIFDRRTAGVFPEIKALKQSVRDIVNPSKHLGHTDRTRTP